MNEEIVIIILFMTLLNMKIQSRVNADLGQLCHLDKSRETSLLIRGIRWILLMEVR